MDSDTSPPKRGIFKINPSGEMWFESDEKQHFLVEFTKEAAINIVQLAYMETVGLSDGWYNARLSLDSDKGSNLVGKRAKIHLYSDIMEIDLFLQCRIKKVIG